MVEADDGPAGGIASLGEGTSVAAATQPPRAGSDQRRRLSIRRPLHRPTRRSRLPADAGSAQLPLTRPQLPPTRRPQPPPPTDPAAPAPTATDAAPIVAPTAAAPDRRRAAPPPIRRPPPSDGTVPVGQKAIFYEERTNVAEGSAETGTIVWSLVQESPGDNLPTEPAIRAEATIPGKDLQLTMTIRRNVDKTLPASHIIELIFLTPENFDGGGIDERPALRAQGHRGGRPAARCSAFRPRSPTAISWWRSTTPRPRSRPT